MTRCFLSTLLLLLAMASPSWAAGAVGHDHLPPHAEAVFQLGPFPVTNSMIMLWIVAAVIILVAQMATRNIRLVPSGLQNFVEWIVEGLYSFLEGILGPHLVKRTFWFFGTIFILILFANWAGLFPGVGTIGRLDTAGFNGDPHDQFRPFFRGANADLNLTAAMAVIFALLWFYWAITENGLKGFLAHIFAPKGKFSNVVMMGFMVIVFGLVGLIEVASILLRPVALSFRLYGNVYAGENMLESMTIMLDKWYLAWLPPLPFYFLEILVGLIQALVFMLLTAVFLKLICDHGDHDEHEDKEHSH